MQVYFKRTQIAYVVRDDERMGNDHRSSAFLTNAQEYTRQGCNTMSRKTPLDFQPYPYKDPMRELLEINNKIRFLRAILKDQSETTQYAKLLVVE